MSIDEAPLEAGTEVVVWIGIRLQYGYPERGVIRQYLPDYPGGPAYEVTFATGSVPFACLPREWLFRVPEGAKA